MSIYDIRFLVGLIGFIACIAIWAGATFREKPNMPIAGWALVFGFVFGLAVFTR